MCSNPNDLDRAEKRGIPICLFSPSLPRALTPIIPIHHEKMNRQVVKEKRKKEKKHGPKCTWYDESSIKLSMIYWLVESHLLKRKTHIQICDQFPNEPFVFHKLQSCALFFFFGKHLLAASHWSASIALSPYSFNTPIFPKSGPKSLLSFSSWRISWKAFL